jgi:hypothetical protein
MQQIEINRFQIPILLMFEKSSSGTIIFGYDKVEIS